MTSRWPRSIFKRRAVRFFLPVLLLQSITKSSGLSQNIRSTQQATTAAPKIYPQSNPKSFVSFSSPILSSGYLPAIVDHNDESSPQKPILLYLPGFDGTLLSPFLQFPELSTVFDIRGMSVDDIENDRSTLDDMLGRIMKYLTTEISSHDAERPIYLMGESFGGILACETVIRAAASTVTNIAGLILVNPATSYQTSELKRRAEELLKWPSLLYPLGLTSKVVPLFLDQYQLPQLALILSSKALPGVIDSREREAYMGRTAFGLPEKLKFMPKETLRWRVEEWLERGSDNLDLNAWKAALEAQTIPVLIFVGEDDKTLPSLEEGQRLKSLILKDADEDERGLCEVVVVGGAGHASTCGSRVDLTAEMRNFFSELEYGGNGRTQMQRVAREGLGDLLGMVPRYDGSTTTGLSPLKYWDDDLYRKWDGQD